MKTKTIDRINITEWDDIVTSIYDAALHPERWDQTLLNIGNPLNAHCGHLIVLSSGGSTIEQNKIVGLDPAVYADFEDCVAQGQMTRINAAKFAKPMHLITDYEHTSELAMKKDPYYQGLAKTHDIGYYGGFILDNQDGLFTGVATCRARKYGHLDTQEMELLGRLTPHLKRSVDLMMLLNHRSFSQGVSEALENHPHAAVLFNFRGKICGLNMKARKVLKVRDGVFESEGHLRVFDSQCQKSLNEEINKIISNTKYLELKHSGVFRVPRKESLTPYVLFLSPIRSRNYHPNATAGVVFIADPNARIPLFISELVNIFGLTPAEAQLVRDLCNGDTLAEIAESRGVVLSTPRFHLKNIFSKIGVKRQVDLVRIVIRTLEIYKRGR